MQNAKEGRNRKKLEKSATAQGSAASSRQCDPDRMKVAEMAGRELNPTAQHVDMCLESHCAAQTRTPPNV